ncbi:MAG TPA: M90 family metallopeptidase [Ideonella sp.]|nr:M90 family metallopeptidase [Ideonella sp.]
MNAALPLLIVAAAALLWVAWLLGRPRWLAWRRERLRSQPFPSAWREILKRRVPYFRRLPADLQLQLKQHIQVFLAEKPFIGCQGQVVTDEVRVTIAAQACLLLLNRPRGEHDYYPNLRQILVYPGAFVVDRVQPMGGGVLRDERQALSGESWTQGQVILSWHDALEGAAVADDGRNVVIHEFAHQLDQETGHANGAPVLARRAEYRRWSQVLGAEFARLQQQAARGETSLISAYGATNPAEFFAVVSEVFFEQPERLAWEHPALYQAFSDYYRIDPLSW